MTTTTPTAGFTEEEIFLYTFLKLSVDTPEKMAARFNKVQGRKAKHFCISFLFCQCLNFLSIILLFILLDSLLDGQFWGYGTEVFKYWQSESQDSHSPLCTVFPTEVSCTVPTGGATGHIDKPNTLCILSNNMFNQYYFLILWVWWCVLLVISGFYILYDLMKLTVPAFTNNSFKYSLVPYNLESQVNNLDMSKFDIYLLARVNQNLKGSEIDALLKELVPKQNQKEMKVNMVETD